MRSSTACSRSAAALVAVLCTALAPAAAAAPAPHPSDKKSSSPRNSGGSGHTGSEADLRTLTGADILLVGGVVPDLALAATAGMGVSGPRLSQLTSSAAGTVTVLRRGGFDTVALDPTPDEAALLAQQA